MLLRFFIWKRNLPIKRHCEAWGGCVWWSCGNLFNRMTGFRFYRLEIATALFSGPGFRLARTGVFYYNLCLEKEPPPRFSIARTTCEIMIVIWTGSDKSYGSSFLQAGILMRLVCKTWSVWCSKIVNRVGKGRGNVIALLYLKKEPSNSTSLRSLGWLCVMELWQSVK